MFKKPKVSQAEIAILLSKHKDLLPILYNDKKTAEERLTEFCKAYLAKIGELK